MFKYNIFILLIISFSVNSFAQNDTVYIDLNRVYLPGEKYDGHSWESAFNSIGFLATLSGKPGDQIWISGSAYLGGENRNAYIEFFDSTFIYGGFLGNETSIDQRNIEANPTIFDGDIGVKGDKSDNLYSIVTSLDSVTYMSFDGIVFQNGNANVKPLGEGGPWDYEDLLESSGSAIFLIAKDSTARVDFKNCKFIDNHIYQHSSVFLGLDYIHTSFDGNFENCDFVNSNFFGGGDMRNCHADNDKERIVCWGSVDSCIFTGKSLGPSLLGEVSNSEFYGFDNFGGIVFNAENCSFHDNGIGITGSSGNYNNCHFYNNEIGILSYSAGLEDWFSSSLNIINCLFENNGIGVSSDNIVRYSGDSIEWDSPLFLEVNNTIFRNNSKGALDIWMKNTTINNCVFYNNESPKEGGAIRSVLGTTQIYNSIFQENIGKDGVNDIYAPHTIIKNNFFDGDNCDAFSKMNYSLVWDTTTYVFDTLSITNILCEGNIFNKDPMFVDVNLGDFHIELCSPALNNGYNSIIDSLNLEKDLDSAPRIQDRIVDIGVYEYDINRVVNHVNCKEETGSLDIFSNSGETFEINWDNGSKMGTSLDSLAIGTYQITVSNGICDFVTTQVITEVQLDVQWEVQDIDNDNLFGSIVINSINGGVEPYDYLWEYGSTENRIDSLTKGVYSVVITDSIGCTFIYTFNISDYTATQDNFSDLTISIYPNPIQKNQKVNLQYNSTHSINSEVTIIDVTGRIISTVEHRLNYGQNLLSCPKEAGIYFLKVEMEDGRMGFEKLVVY